jgi:hypothetical protein
MWQMKINRSCALVYRQNRKILICAALDEQVRVNFRLSPRRVQKCNHHKACNRGAMKVSGASSFGTSMMADFKDREVPSLPL